MFARLLRVGLAGALFAALAPTAAADIIVVPTPEDGIFTIQDGVDAAGPGDVVKVSRGNFFETVEVFKDDITLMGNRTQIDSQYEGTNIHIRGDDVTVMNFHLVDGQYGVLALGNRINVSKVQVHAPREDGIAIQGSDPRVFQNKIWGAGGRGIAIGDIDDGCCCCVSDGDPCDGGGPCCCDADGQGCDGNPCCVDGGECDGGGPCCCDGGGCDSDGEIIGIPGSTAYVSRNFVSRCRREGIDVEHFQMEINRNKVELCEAGIVAETRVIQDGGGGQNSFSSIFDNKVETNDEVGIFVENFFNGDVRLEKNRANGNCGIGIHVRGFNFVVQRNFAKRNTVEGFRAEGTNYALIKNTADYNRGDGFACFAGFSFCDEDGCDDADGIPPQGGGGGGRVVEGNGAKDNGGNGIRTFGDNYFIAENKLMKNCGDGIDLNLGKQFDGFIPNIVIFNRVEKNLHEGIDNDTRDAAIDNNTVRRNNGDDMAARGEGNGSVSSFVGNSFDTGGAATFQILDNDYFFFSD